MNECTFNVPCMRCGMIEVTGEALWIFGRPDGAAAYGFQCPHCGTRCVYELTDVDIADTMMQHGAVVAIVNILPPLTPTDPITEADVEKFAKQLERL